MPYRQLLGQRPKVRINVSHPGLLTLFPRKVSDSDEFLWIRPNLGGRGKTFFEAFARVYFSLIVGVGGDLDFTPICLFAH